nr:gustatory receptor 25 [Papilio machaon]
MEPKKHTNIDDISAYIVKSMKPLLCIEYSYGIFRCRLSGRCSDAVNLRMKMLGIAITMTWLTVFFGYTAFPVENFEQMLRLQDKALFMLIGFTYASSSIVFVLFHTQKYQRALEILAGVDIALFENINGSVYKISFRHCKILFLLYIFHFITWLALYLYFREGFYRYVYILFLFIYFERKIEILVFCQFLYMLEQRLLLIKNYLSELTCDRDRDTFLRNTKNRVDFNFIGHISSTNYKIRNLACVYTKIGKISMLINETFNYLIVMTLATAFSIIIIIVWSLLNGYKSFKTYIWSLPILYSIYVELLSIILLSCYCENIIAARAVLKKLLFSITSQENLPLSMIHQANVFVELTEIWHLSINVFHMFDINLQLILKFISICTSYLIVVIQTYLLI